jgi:prolyl-tRNA editing enzyme YbaK/EbsC (Cys-tRNA(Pro) deacylase)
MHPTVRKFVDTARDRHDFAVEISEFPEGTKTAADAADAVGCDVSQIVKSIVLTVERDEPTADPSKSVIVVLTAGDHHVDTDTLAGELDANAADTADAETVKSHTGWSIGGVPPFCHENDLPVYLDESLTGHETVWAAAGTPEAVFPISPDALVEISDPTLLDTFVTV